jgi:chemotaxis protein methyltransferase CheR
MPLLGRNTPPLDSDQYKRFSDLLLERCGLRFPDNRRAELDHGVRQAFASSACSTLDEFYKLLKTPGNTVEMDLLINAVTVSETHFFRDTAQFNAIYQQVLPQIIERKKSIRTLRIWSAGCATGEEPYSLAILLRELLPDIENWSITLLATDINTFSLDRARRGQFTEWAFREERARQMRLRYFQKSGNRYELNPEIRQMVTFARLNLVEPSYPSYETNTTLMDMIICRNVTIYFSETVTRWVVDRFFDSLSDRGWLVVGHSEPSLETYQRFQIRNYPDTVIYQKELRPEAYAQPATRFPGLSFPGASQTPAFGQSPVTGIPASTNIPTVTPAQKPAAQQSLQNMPGYVPTSKLPDLLEHADSLLDDGRSEEAIKILLDLAAARPKDARICTHLGQAYANLGSWTEAEAWCYRAISIDKLALKAYYALALVLQHEGRLADAIEQMKKVVYLDRLFVLGHYGLANMYHESKQIPQAMKSLENALRLLQTQPPEQIVPGSQGITVGRLREAIILQQQNWSKL